MADPKNTLALIEQRYSKRLKLCENDVAGNSISILQTLSDPAKEVPAGEAQTALDLLINSSEEVNNRRQGINNFFLTINTLLLGGIGWLLSESIPKSLFPTINVTFVVGVISAIGLVLCLLWLKMIRSYGLVSHTKILLAESIESYLPLKVFTVQYRLMKLNKYFALSHLESGIAWVFFLLHIALFVIVICYGFHLIPCFPLPPHAKAS